MPINVLAKIKSAPNKVFFSSLLAVVILCFAVLAVTWAARSHTRTLTVGKQVYTLEAATTEAEHAKGLGGRTSMSKDKGMVFVFQKPQKLCFWMKDMHFPLDMIWLNSSKQVIKTASNVQPSTYPKTYCSDSMAQYVIELDAGQLHTSQVRMGQTLHF